MDFGGNLESVGDAKQLQPIAAGGIFRTLYERHGKAEISNIKLQRIDFAPLVDWLRLQGALARDAALALKALPEDDRLDALEALCAVWTKLAAAFDHWRARFDHSWLRAAVQVFATGDAKAALTLMDDRGRLKLISGHGATIDAFISDWAADKSALASKTMIAGTRAEARELSARARGLLISSGQVRDEAGLDIEIIHRDESREVKRFAPSDRIVFTKNDKEMGVANRVAVQKVIVSSHATGSREPRLADPAFAPDVGRHGCETGCPFLPVQIPPGLASPTWFSHSSEALQLDRER